MVDEPIPTWVVGMFALVGLFGVGAVIYIIKEMSRPWRAPAKRTYRAGQKEVSAAIDSALEQLPYAVYSRDENSVSIARGYMSGWGVATGSVVHLIMLPTDDGATDVEAVGARGQRDYEWHVMAQSLIEELDQRLTTPHPASSSRGAIIVEPIVEPGETTDRTAKGARGRGSRHPRPIRRIR